MAKSNAFFVGLYLGVLQWGAFFLLQSYMVSTALVYLMMVVVWLLGGLLGLRWTGRVLDVFWLGLSLIAYYSFYWVTTTFFYTLSTLPALITFVFLMGSYAGYYFRTNQIRFSSSKSLFFYENTGFLVGMILSFLAVSFYGDNSLRWAPIVSIISCLLTSKHSNYDILE